MQIDTRLFELGLSYAKTQVQRTLGANECKQREEQTDGLTLSTALTSRLSRSVVLWYNDDSKLSIGTTQWRVNCEVIERED